MGVVVRPNFERKNEMLVGVVYNGKALMPTCHARARKLIASKHATPFIHKGMFCIRLNKEPSGTKTQVVVIRGLCE